MRPRRRYNNTFRGGQAAMRISTFASGSSGNCTLLSYAGTHILIDAGISMKRISASLSLLDLEPKDVSGVLITHEHSDHVCGLATMTKKHHIPIFAPRAAAGYIRRSIAGVDDCLEVITPGVRLCIGDMEITAFSTPHDAPDSVGFTVTADVRFGFCTDLGHITDEVLRALEGVDAAIIEANHDVDMLKAGRYPYFLKKRILSDNGHLSNECCGTLASSLVKSGTQALVLGHLSRENNRPEVAGTTVRGALAMSGVTESDAVRVFTAPPSELRCLTVERNGICWD